MRMAVEVFSLNDKAVDAPARIVGERPIAALRSGRDVSAARPSRSEPFVPCPVQAACTKAPATNVDLRLKAGIGPTNALERALGHAGLRPARRLPWRIRRWRFKGLTGGDRTGCAACWRRRGAVVAEPRLDFVGLAPPAGNHRAPRRPITADGALHSCRGRRSRTWRTRIGFLTSALHRASERDVDGRDGGRSGRAEEGASAASPSVPRQSSGRSKNRSGGDGRRPVDVVVLDRVRLEGEAFVEFDERNREADFRHVERVVVLQD